MAQGKQTPRQKMINLMYLVFIAMLAMTIDQDIIRSYQDTNQSLQDTRTLTQNNNGIFERTLKAKAESSPENFQVPLQNYESLKAKADILVSNLDGIKGELIKQAEFDPNLNVEENFTSLNNTEPSTKMFFADGDENSPSNKAKEVQNQINEFRTFVNQTFGGNKNMSSVVQRANAQMITVLPSKIKGKNWIQYKFYNQPLIAALSNMEVIQSSVRGIQADALSLMLQEKIDADIKFDAYQAIVSAPTQVVQGETAVAKVSIGNYSNSVPGLSMPGLTVTNGQGITNLNTSSAGQKTFAGKISFSDKRGVVHDLPYSQIYNVVNGVNELVAQKGALLSADKMNVLYRGLPNPITGSVLGADTGGLSLSAPGASVSGGRGKWVVTPGGGATVTLTISGKDSKGATISQAFPFRIKSVPPPVGEVQGKSVVSMPASSIANQKVSAVMPDFDFPVSFSVNSFMFKVPGRAALLVNGNSLSGVAALTKNLRNGDVAYIYNISATATGLGNQVLKQIPPIVINVQ
ncbi:type IX secretion system motor protein PorM/GldM [Halpernia frigidisoli]|uniref:Gliding motility-associated protein GldM n=1 Tax=Halpernia frigidisoli TaxID=1125876 RepID=A0A1I3FB78_9FLAO|nr:gliding motility protein GldM [Halpernia frigidisoli]SFI08439.1 gliding motility-associated protein GldM [Halpernia frigidisoli]